MVVPGRAIQGNSVRPFGARRDRRAQVTAMVDSIVGMVGDLHGIMGQTMAEISAVDEPPMVEGKTA
jgi:hypothetical protein